MDALVEEHSLCLMGMMVQPARRGGHRFAEFYANLEKLNGVPSTPSSDEADQLPLVLLVHGGQWAHDARRYSPGGEMSADRGWAHTASSAVLRVW